MGDYNKGGRWGGSWPARRAKPYIAINLYKVTFFHTIKHELKVLTKVQKTRNIGIAW
jgi:hypothetical protein